MKQNSIHLHTRFALPVLLVLCAAASLCATAPDAGGKRYAVLIGINEYADSSIVKLTTPRNDVADLGSTLAASGWDKVFMLKDDADYRNQDFPSRTNIENRINLLADLAQSEDTVFFFLAVTASATEMTRSFCRWMRP